MKHVARHADRLKLCFLLGLIAVAYLLLRHHYALGSLVLAGIYALAIMGLVVLIGFGGQFSLGHAAFFGIGAYAAALLARRGYPGLVTLPAAAVVAAIVAMTVGYPLLRLRGYYLAMATLAFGLITLSILNGWRSLTFGPSGISAIPPLALGPLHIATDEANYWTCWVMTLGGIWSIINLRSSRFGQAMLAIKRDETAAAAMGIDVHLMKVKAFGLSAAFAGLAGALYAHYVAFVSPERFNVFASFELLLAALLGGTGTPFGAVLGALILIWLPEAVAPLHDYKTVAYGVIFILMSLYLPQGLAGAGSKLLQMWHRLDRGQSNSPLSDAPAGANRSSGERVS